MKLCGGDFFLSDPSHLFNQLFPNLNKVVFLDDDIVVQRDLSPLWEINLEGKVNGAVETCRGEDNWVMSKRFRTYFNFSHPVISRSLDPDECAWAYGMNIFDLAAWRKTNIRDTYHFWLKEVMLLPSHESPFPALFMFHYVVHWLCFCIENVLVFCMPILCCVHRSKILKKNWFNNLV